MNKFFIEIYVQEDSEGLPAVATAVAAAATGLGLLAFTEVSPYLLPMKFQRENQ